MDEEARLKRNAYMREWNAKHRERIREYHRTRYATDLDHAERARQRAADWYAANRERALAREKARYEANRVLKGRPSGEDVHNWKGEDVGYDALHRWVSRHKGKPSLCEHCGTTTASVFEWANVDHKYRRDLADWMRLCRTCHRRHDYGKGLSKKRGPNKPA